MTFSSKLDKETPQSLWEQQKALGGRMLLTMPFGSSVEQMQGFISVLGGADDQEEYFFPVLTLCVEKPNGGAIASTVVFPSKSIYLEFIDRLHIDAYSNFASLDEIILN